MFNKYLNNSNDPDESNVEQVKITVTKHSRMATTGLGSKPVKINRDMIMRKKNRNADRCRVSNEIRNKSMEHGPERVSMKFLRCFRKNLVDKKKRRPVL